MFIKMTANKKKKFMCYFGHDWINVKTSKDGKTYYWECGRCKTRQIVQHDKSDEDIDTDFVWDA